MTDPDFKRWVQGIYEKIASEYGGGGNAFYDHFGRCLVERADVQVGERVLDVGTGTGAVLRHVIQRVGPAGRAVGIDLSPQMVARASTVMAEVHVMDAEHLLFPDASFDVILCGFSFPFFTSHSTALREFKRVLRPGGRLALSTWTTPLPLTTFLTTQAEKLGATPQKGPRHLRDPHAVRALLAEHFEVLDQLEEHHTLSHPTAHAWWESQWARCTRDLLDQLSDQQLHTLRQLCLDHARSCAQGGVVGEQLEAVITLARPKIGSK